MWLGAPGEWQIGAKAFGVAGPEAANLATLPVKIAAQFTRHIDDAPTAVVVAHVHDVAVDPHVMRAGFRHRILRHLAWVIDVRDVHHVHDAAHRDALAVVDVKNLRKYFVADKHVVLVTKN